MANLFTFLKGFAIRCVAIIIAVCFLCSVSHAKTVNYHHGSFSFDKIEKCHFSAILVDVVKVPLPNVADYLFPVNDAKPVNTNYQIIRHRTLNLVFTHRNF